MKACKHCGEVKFLKGGYCGKRKCVDAKGETNRHIKNADVPDEMDRTQYAHFYSLVRPKPEKKKRNCLRCRKEFVACKNGSENNRICGECHYVNANQGYLATVTPISITEVLSDY